jgi:hypothetical protein
VLICVCVSASLCLCMKPFINQVNTIENITLPALSKIPPALHHTTPAES